MRLTRAIACTSLQAVASTDVLDILEACGLDRPDISVIAEIRDMRQRNLVVETLKKLSNLEIEARARTNVVKQEKFSQRLRDAIARYHNRSVDALQVIQEMIELARKLQEEGDERLRRRRSPSTTRSPRTRARSMCSATTSSSSLRRSSCAPSARRGRWTGGPRDARLLQGP